MEEDLDTEQELQHVNDALGKVCCLPLAIPVTCISSLLHFVI